MSSQILHKSNLVVLSTSCQTAGNVSKIITASNTTYRVCFMIVHVLRVLSVLAVVNLRVIEVIASAVDYYTRTNNVSVLGFMYWGGGCTMPVGTELASYTIVAQ